MILLAGAAGTLGSAVARALKRENLKFIAIDVNAEKLKAIEGLAEKTAVCDMAKKESLSGLLKGVKTVISTVGLQRESENVTYMSVDFQGNKNLLDEAKANGAEQFIYVSALATKEDAPRKVHQAKWLMECALRESGVKYTTFRPSGFMSDYIWYFGKEMKTKDTFEILGTGEMKVQPIHIDDLATCIAKAVGNPKAFDKVFPIGGPEQMTLNQILDFYQEFFNRKVKIIRTPLEEAEKKGLPKDFLLRMKTDSVCDITDVKNAFGLKFRSLKECVKEVDWSKV